MNVGCTALPDPSPHRPTGRCLLGSAPHCLDSCRTWSRSCHSVEPQASEESLLFTSYLEAREELGKRSGIERFAGTRFSLLSSPTPSPVWLVRDCLTSCLDLRCFRN